MTQISSQARGIDQMMSTARRMDGFQQQMNGLVGLLLRLIDDQGSIVLHVTAASPGEGTSTVARGLAVAAAQAAWCKVALLNSGEPDALLPGDALPNVLHAFDAAKKPALMVQRVGERDMSIGSLSLSGAAAPNMERMRALYASLRASFTLTVIDCPPVNTSQAMVTYSKLADGVLLVVSAERTRVADIERAQANLTQFGATILGTVMNRHRRRLPRFLDRLL
jgi:Mrp family chromosome partitioning ATPase